MTIKETIEMITESNDAAIGLLIINQDNPDAIRTICEALTHNSTALKRLIKVMESE